MLKCEGYIMFNGVMRIVPKTDKFAPYEEEGTWLYKPQFKTWYCKGSSYPEELCEIVRDDTN